MGGNMMVSEVTDESKKQTIQRLMRKVNVGNEKAIDLKTLYTHSTEYKIRTYATKFLKTLFSVHNFNRYFVYFISGQG